MIYRITRADLCRAAWGRIARGARLVPLVSALLTGLLLASGCMETKEARSEHRTTTETWQGSVTIPAPQPAANGGWSVVPTPVPFSLTKTTEENSDGTTHTQTGIDPAAVAQIGSALAGALKTAFPAIGAVSDAASGGMDLLKALLGGTTIGGIGLAALKHRQASRAQADNDEAWDKEADARTRAAAAEARLAERGHTAPVVGG